MALEITKIRQKGLKADYDPEGTHLDIIYFATDTGEIYLNGETLGIEIEGDGEDNQVLVYNGDTHKAKWDSVSNIFDFKDYLSYGVLVDESVKDPHLTRTGNMALHKSLPIQSQYKGCIVKDHKVVYYLDSDNWKYKDGGNPDKGLTEDLAVLDGTDGDVCVEIPEFYGYCYDLGDGKWDVRISLYQISPDWFKIPHMYWGAYAGTIDRSTNDYKAHSVVNTTTAFRGGNNNAVWDSYLGENELVTQLGKPATNFTRPQWRTYCSNSDVNPTNYEYYKWVIYWAFVIEYANFNSQENVNSELTTDGYHQGGLGYGLADSCGLNATGTYAIVPCGYTNELGNGTGEKKVHYDSIKLQYGREPGIEHWNPVNLTHKYIDYQPTWLDGYDTSVKALEFYTVNPANYLFIDSYRYDAGVRTYAFEGLPTGTIVSATNGTLTELYRESGDTTDNVVVQVNWGTNGNIRLNFNSTASNLTVRMYYETKVYGSEPEPYTINQLTSYTGYANRYRGIENPFAEFWEFQDGVLVIYDSTVGKNKLYSTTKHPFDDIQNEEDFIGYISNSGGFGSKLLMGTRADIFPVEVKGSQSTYTCDNYWADANASLRVLLSGGFAYGGFWCGLGCLYVACALSWADAAVGGRLFSLSAVS